MQISFDVRWRIRFEEQTLDVDPRLFETLGAIRAGGSISFAARSLDASYRHLWGLIRQWETRFGKRLVTLQRGRGADLTTAGNALLDAFQHAGVQLGEPLARASRAASTQLHDVFADGAAPVRIAASHSELIYRLRDRLGAAGHTVTLDLVGTEHALRRYRVGAADIAGFHLPLGELGPAVASPLIKLLDDARDHVRMLEQRTLGLMSRRDQPCRDLEALAAGGLRFVNRQPGSGTRLTFDDLLVRKGIAPNKVNGYGDEEYTHTAVAALVSSGSADTAFGARAAAEHLGLHFEPMVEERFYLVAGKDTVADVWEQIDLFFEERRPGIEAGGTPGPETRPTVNDLRRIHG